MISATMSNDRPQMVKKLATPKMCQVVIFTWMLKICQNHVLKFMILFTRKVKIVLNGILFSIELFQDIRPHKKTKLFLVRRFFKI